MVKHYLRTISHINSKFIMVEWRQSVADRQHCQLDTQQTATGFFGFSSRSGTQNRALITCFRAFTLNVLIVEEETDSFSFKFMSFIHTKWTQMHNLLLNFISHSFRGCCDVDLADNMVSPNIFHVNLQKR